MAQPFVDSPLQYKRTLARCACLQSCG